MLDSGGQVGELIARAQAAVAAARWLEALDFASQALAVDPQQTEAAALVGTARQRLGTVSAAGAELRQVTVVAVDMAASTAIAARLGPERMRELMLALYELCVEAITRYEGRVTKYSGDGVLAQFGHPVAHDDDARRAVLAAFGILEAVEVRAARWEARHGEQVRVRIGIDSGIAAVGPMDESPWSPEEIAGDPPNVATRVQSSADPMTIRVTEATKSLIEGWFETSSIGEVELRNYPRPVGLHRVIRSTEADTRLEADLRPRPLLVNREHELGVIRAAWNEVIADGGRRVVEIRGEGGIGKSRLAEHMLATAVASGATHLTLPCSAVHRDSPLRPVVRALTRIFRVFPREGGSENLWVDAIQRRLEQLPGRKVPTEEAVPIISWMLGIRAGVDLEPDDLRRREFEVLLDLFGAMASESLLVLSVEDVDTADPSTIEFLNKLLERDGLLMLVIVTSREKVGGLPAADHELELGGLDPSHARVLARLVSPDLDESTVERLVTRADGVPFFTEELARAAAHPDGATLAETVELSGFLTARLDELDPELRRVLRPVAIAGGELPLELVCDVTELSRQRVDELIAELHQRRVVVRTGTPAGDGVRFRHSLMRHAAYESILESRRGPLHLRLAELMERASFPPEDVAAQFEPGGDRARAAPRWLEAAEHAAAAGANAEAAELFKRCLAALDALPPGPERAGIELSGQLGLGTIITVVEGYTSSAGRAAFERAVNLAQSLEDNVAVLPALWGAWAYWFVLGEHAVAGPLTARCVRIADENPHRPELRLLAAAIDGYHLLYLGELERSQSELEWTARLRDVKPPEVFPHDPVTVGVASRAVVQWLLGDSPGSRELAREAAEQLKSLDPAGRRTALTQCFVGCLLAWRAELDGDHETAIELAERATATATERGYPTWIAAGVMHRSIALCSQGHYDEGLPTLAAMVTAWRTAGQNESGRQLHPVLMTPYFAGRMAEGQLASGDAAGAVAEIDRILHDSAGNGERFWDVELLRVRAAARRALNGSPEQASRDLEQARELAERQHAHGLLARLARDEEMLS